MAAQPCRMAIIRIYLHRNSSALHLLRSLYLHLHQGYLHGRHLRRLDMAVPKAFCLPVSILLSSKAFPHRGVLHHLDLDLHLECPLDFNSQGLEELGSRERSEEHRSDKSMRKCRAREEGLAAVTL